MKQKKDQIMKKEYQNQKINKYYKSYKDYRNKIIKNIFKKSIYNFVETQYKDNFFIL